MNEQVIKYENRLVAFIDILGFKEIVKQSENDQSKVELIYAVLNYLKNWETSEAWDLKHVEIEEDAQFKGVENFDISKKTNSTSFSDSIVVSVKVDNNVNEMDSVYILEIIDKTKLPKKSSEQKNYYEIRGPYYLGKKITSYNLIEYLENEVQHASLNKLKLHHTRKPILLNTPPKLIFFHKFKSACNNSRFKPLT